MNLINPYKFSVAAPAEFISNGTFDTDTVWSNGTGWTIGSGVASHAPGTGSNVSQTIPAMTVGKTYRFKFDVVSYMGGQVRFYTPGSIASAPLIAAAGTYSYDWVATSADTTANLNGLSAFQGSVDNASIIQLD